MNLTRFTLLLLWLSGSAAMAQDTLTLNQAVDIALENNYAIRVAKQQTAIAEQQIYPGNAGMTPTVDYNLNIGANGSYVNQQFLDGRTINRFGRSFSPSTNVALQWTLYDGRLMQTNFEILKSQGQRQLAQQQLTVQNTIVAVMQTYYDLLLQSQSRIYLQTIIKFYQERLNITQQRWEFGRGSKLDYLQSQNDLTTQLSTLAQVENALQSAKIRLNRLLARDANTDFEVTSQDTPATAYNLSEVMSNAQSYNPELLLLQKQIELAKLNEQAAESFRKPRIAVNSSFGYSLSTNTAGFIALNQSTGLNLGLTARWNIYNGQQTRRNISIAKMNTDAFELQKQDLQQQIDADVLAAYNQYIADEKVEEIEEENQGVAEENLTISLEKYRLGGSTILELNEAQRTYNTALNRLVNARFNRQISEIELLRLSGMLIR